MENSGWVRQSCLLLRILGKEVESGPRKDIAHNPLLPHCTSSEVILRANLVLDYCRS